MVLPLVAAGVSAIGSLLGGRKAAKEQRRAIAAQNAYNDPSAIRARAEKAGFNPLLFVGPGVGLQTSIEQPVMGQAIANAGLALASGMMEQAEMQAQQSAVMQQNYELRKQIEKMTLRPVVPGIFRQASGAGGGTGASNVAVPSVPRGIEQTVINAPGMVAPVKLSFGPEYVGDEYQGYAPAGEASDLYPFRMSEVMPVKSIPVIADVEMPDGTTFPVPHDGDEIMGIEKLPVFGGSWGVDWLREKAREKRSQYDRAGITTPGKQYTWSDANPLRVFNMLPDKYQPWRYGEEFQRKQKEFYTKSPWRHVPFAWQLGLGR